MSDESSLLNASLERAGEMCGDITEPAMARFYKAYAQARRLFDLHGVQGRARLEAEMVGNVLYWAMIWPERRVEVATGLADSVPHHEEVLKVPVALFRGLTETVIDLIVETIPPDATAELALWRQLRAELGEAIESSKLPLAPRAAAHP